MTLAADFRLVSRRAKIGFAFAQRGLVPEACSSWFLPRLVGVTQALEWTITGEVFAAEDAAHTGLFSGFHEEADLLPAALDLARHPQFSARFSRPSQASNVDHARCGPSAYRP